MGAEISLVNRETWELCGSFPLVQAPCLTMYTGSRIPTLGRSKHQVLMEVGGRVFYVHLTVVESKTQSNLLGRDFLLENRLNWHELIPHRCPSVKVVAAHLCQMFAISSRRCSKTRWDFRTTMKQAYI